jgi:hypothetical protein
MPQKYKFEISPNSCAINNKNSTQKNKNTTCYSKESLELIANKLNETNEKKIKIKNKSKKKIWDKIQENFYETCSNKEACWKNQKDIKDLKNTEIQKFTFKPDYPTAWKSNKNTWLNTYDIYNVMKQYEKKHKDFKFLGAIPSDCPVSINCELSNLDLMDLKKKKIHKIGIIYNLDVSTGPGTHWVAVYIDNKNNEINYYDSYGHMPTKLIHEFITNIHNKYQQNKHNSVVIYNDKRHQYGGSECGMYSINFILERLYGNTMYDISTRVITDKAMNDLREKIYNMNY